MHGRQQTIATVVGAGELQSDIASITKSPFIHVYKFFVSNPKLLKANNRRFFTEQPIQYPVVPVQPIRSDITFAATLILFVESLVNWGENVEGGTGNGSRVGN
jgi:hypothetical protein